MAMKYMALARKLQSACNSQYGAKLLINSHQWFSEDQGRAVTQYTVCQSTKRQDTGKDVNLELFKTYSQVQLVLFFRDYWYKLNGWEVPKDNAKWEEVKDQNGSTGTENAKKK